MTAREARIAVAGPGPARPTAGARATSRAGRITLLTVGLLVALVLATLVSASTGQLGIPPIEVLRTVGRSLGLPVHGTADDLFTQALWTIRFPRVVLALMIGAALAAAGVLMQAVFANPLADPGVVGVSGGAAFGACASIVLGLQFAGYWTTPLMAFAAGLVATLLVYALSRAGGRTEVVTLLLTGIAVNAFTGAGLAFLTFLGDQQAREQIVFWQLGSLNGSMWDQAGAIAPVVVLGLVGAVVLTRSLDLLSLGDRAARHVGVRVEAVRVVAIVVVALLVGAAVAFAGIIAFVGLVVPHLMRMLIGPAHGPLLLVSTLGGALLLTVADLLARTLVPYADLPIGMLTSLVGGPFFFWLLRRARRRSGGWA